MWTADKLKYAPNLKLQRARHHINDFKDWSTTFIDGKPFKLWERHERKAGINTSFVNQEKSITPELSLIIADAIHNMRAALDLVLFGMAGHIAPKIHFPFPSAGDTKTVEASIQNGH